ncbi:MAG: right-handed parallel beta-helix repeat-containing protein [Pontiellaceae bacterium]|nr:right-handed parallel beta-helix repeat-containing protein [Pontiellaceae bacterium]MBN2786528.1 right-handed parallel beta-helix repeat-containing protein [Pontiellaceae bacterium]
MVFSTFYVCSAQAEASAVFRVDGNLSTGMRDGSAWRDAFASVQDAIDAASRAGGGEVWVKAGIYRPAGSGRSATFQLKPGVRLLGGFRGDETERLERNPKANRTTLNGDIGAPADESDNCYHLVTGSTDAQIDGFTLSRGQANGLKEQGVGGALFIPSGTRKIVITNCLFEKNSAGWQGGAIYADRAELTISNCIFSANGAANGGALAFGGNSEITVLSTAFTANQSLTSGGAVALEGEPKIMLKDCRFSYNVSGGDGGALYAAFKPTAETKLQIESSIFSDNRADKSGGALYLKGGNVPLLKACRIERNAGLKGAGGITLDDDTSIVAENCVISANRGQRDMPNIQQGTNALILDSAALASVEEITRPEEKKVEEPKRRTLANVAVYNEENQPKQIHDLISDSPYTVLILGDLTDPDFIENYRSIEAAANDYGSATVQFYYIYKTLSHPENNGYVEPFTDLERARQMQLANALLKTRVPWFYDGMDNALQRLLKNDSESNVFICSDQAEECFSGEISKPESIRKALDNLIGPAASQTDPSRYSSPRIPSKDPGKPVLVNRIHFNPDREVFVPLKIEPNDSQHPFYAKLRVEADADLLESGNGRLYLGFHLDPLYHMQWDNREKPLVFNLAAPVGIVAPSSDSAEEIKSAEFDAEPREFVLRTRQLDLSKPLVLRVMYSVASPSQGKNIQVSQQYVIHLEQDRLAGRAYRRQIDYKDPERKVRRVIMPGALRHLDANGDGQLTRGELTGNLWSKFPQIDTDKDGLLSDAEYRAYQRNR